MPYGDTSMIDNLQRSKKDQLIIPLESMRDIAGVQMAVIGPPEIGVTLPL
jgi:hypothetical protein